MRPEGCDWFLVILIDTRKEGVPIICALYPYRSIEIALRCNPVCSDLQSYTKGVPPRTPYRMTLSGGAWPAAW
jgi:hypothetical protein